ncbi:hypothetical protein [Streptomyces sp. NPDC088812]|uniref:hypothetical protein n=1 Tax=Streptomyces sp. NPDC088812 TaxID=3365905 RepID=UPI00380F3EDD
MPGTVLLLAASPVGKGCLVEAASVLPVLAAVPPAVLAGTDTANVVELADPLEPQAVLTRLRAAAAAPGPLTVFVAGQLQLDRRQRLPHLALARTTPATVRYTAFPWHWFREELRLRPPGATTLLVDLHADAETWQWLRGRGLDCGPAVAVHGRIAPPPGRRRVASPTYMRAVATILRSGGRPPAEQLHQMALARIASEGEVGDLVVSGVGPAVAPSAPSAAAAPFAAAPFPGSPFPGGAVPVPDSVPDSVPAPASPAVAAQTPPASVFPGFPAPATPPAAHADPTLPAPPTAPVPAAPEPASALQVPVPAIPGTRTPEGAGGAGQDPSRGTAQDAVQDAVQDDAAWGTGQGAARDAVQDAVQDDAAWGTGQGAARDAAQDAEPDVTPDGAPPVAAAPDSASPVPDDDPHAAITTAVQSGQHTDADALAARCERAAAAAHGPGSQEALHWTEVRADLAMFAGDAERSCRTWMAVASARLAAGQPADAPAVEAAVDRAHHQWGRIADPDRARELGPDLADLRGRVPGRREGALDHVRQHLHQLQTQG